MSENSQRIDACFDSHVHWAATGEFATRLRLEQLGSAREILNIDCGKIPLRQDWILGFGWDQTDWPDKNEITRELLDRWSPERPVLLTRIDAHVGWVNTAALQAAKLDLAKYESGVLRDQDYELLLQHVPRPSASDIRRDLLKATQIFHAEGFTHVRDVGGAIVHWEQALLLDRARLLNLAVEMFFHVAQLDDLEMYCEFVEAAKNTDAENLRAKGIKIFVDGALGSEGAWISEPYASGSGHGLQLLGESEIEHILRTVWPRGLEVAIHVIGDAAVHRVVTVADRLRAAGVIGRLHLEHAEIVRPETIALMKGLNVVCHLQPCHWLSDRRWLRDKVGDQLYKWSFPWRRLQEADVEFDFGSDTPIEPPSVARTLQALNESAANGVGKLLGKPERFMSHPNRAWAPNCYSIFEAGRPVQVVFRGGHLV